MIEKKPLLKLSICGCLLALACESPEEGSIGSASEEGLRDTASSWYSQIQRRIGEEEYRVSETGGVLSASNRANNFAVAFGDGGFSLSPRVNEKALAEIAGLDGADPDFAALRAEIMARHEERGWSLALGLIGTGTGDAADGSDARLDAAENVAPLVGGCDGTERIGATEGCFRQVEWQRSRVVEVVRNLSDGVEHGYAITARPAGSGRFLVVSSRYEGLSAAERDGGQTIIFRDAEADRVKYAGLAVTDAAGNDLDASMHIVGDAVNIVIDDEGAAYPLLVDPLATSPAWTAEGDQGSSRFGYSVSSAGDVNCDGFGDVIVGAPYFDNGQANEGRAFAFLGSSGGLEAIASWTAESDQASAYFGWSAASAGDVDGNGCSDVIVGAPYYDGGQTNEGRVYVFLGSAGGLEATASWTAESDQASSSFGTSVASAGDVNGDGYADVLVGAHNFDNDQINEGRVFVFLGSSGGLGATASWTAESNQVGSYFGFSVASAGDITRDGYADIIVGAPRYDNGQTDEGRVFVYRGSSAGLTSAAWTVESDQAGANFGDSVSSAGDVNGDRNADIVVGSPGYDNGQADEGRVFVYRVTSKGIVPSPWTAESDLAGAAFGDSVASAGDVNGDGYADVVVGASFWENAQADEGGAFVYLGSSTGLGTTPSWTAEGNQVSAYFGQSAASAGDVNGDGFSDVVVGAWKYDDGETDEGGVFLYLGSNAGLKATASWIAESDQAEARFGLSVAAAGDVNADGFADVVVGAPSFDNGEVDEGRAFVFHGSSTGLATTAAWTAEGDQAYAHFGQSAASAGDVNGDGYADVVVGAPDFDNAEPGEGRAYAFLGSSTGLATTAAWTAESDQASAYFGKSVASAGDVNGDGYADVVVGAHIWPSTDADSDSDVDGDTDADKRFVFVYNGSSAGLGVTPAWTQETPAGDPSETYAYDHASVSSAGDVNGDGYSDLAVGYVSTNLGLGIATVYYGSSEGLAAATSWTANGGQQGSRFGSVIASAGDVNGDGYSDVVVGAAGYDDVQYDKGRAYVFLGSGTGLSTSASWSPTGDQGYAYFGASAASAGDVNGDGYSDVVIGAREYDNGQLNEGRAYVYLGSNAGLATTAAWTAESDQASASFGTSVASAGDLNGDGYSDLLVGAPGYDNVENNEGRAFVYYGGEGGALGALAPLQRNSALANVSPLGVSDSASAFRVNALLPQTGPMGRSKVKLQWEVKPHAAPFDGLDLAESASWIDTWVQSAVTEPVTDLIAGSSYHWRARLLYQSGGWSRWFAFDRTGGVTPDIRTP